MSSIPYPVIKPISAALGWPTEFYQTAFEVLTKHNGLGFLTGDAVFTRIKPVTAYQVLKHLAYRTLPFNKICEFVRIRDVKEGKAALDVAGVSCSEPTVERILYSLSPPRSNYLVKLRLPWHRAQTAIYGLNLPFILKSIDEAWQGAMDEAGKRKIDHYESTDVEIPAKTNSHLADKGRLLLGHCIDFVLIYKKAFTFLLSQNGNLDKIEDVKSFTINLKNHLPSQKECQRAQDDFLNRVNPKQIKLALEQKRTEKPRKK